MSHVAVKFSQDWSDEFQVEGIYLFESEEWDMLKSALKSISDYCVGIYFGTNEGWDDEDIQWYLDTYEELDITEKTYNALMPLMSGGGCGTGVDPRMIIEIVMDCIIDDGSDYTEEMLAYIRKYVD